MKNTGQLEQTGSLDSLALIARAVASPTGSLIVSPASLEAAEVMNFTQSNSLSQSPVTFSQEKSNENTNKVASDNNTNNFFTAAPSCFKVGDKCRITRQCWQVPVDKELTITKIEGAIATVRYKGCMSHSGVEVELSWLEPWETQNID